jgi:hypothetical protein
VFLLRDGRSMHAPCQSLPAEPELRQRFGPARGRVISGVAGINSNSHAEEAEEAEYFISRSEPSFHHPWLPEGCFATKRRVGHDPGYSASPASPASSA